MVNTPNEEDFNQAIQRILTEEYMDAFDDLTVLFKPLEQRKEMIDRIEGRLNPLEVLEGDLTPPKTQIETPTD